ncbi:splicing factor 3A subunit 1-like protein [Amazona aestiva]|nr:splicing factor 3A subunit 1-like protein [Amazona aestiva]
MPPVHPPPPMEDEPVSKKLKSEDSLIPEEEFLRRNKVSVIKVKIHEATGMPAGKQKLQYEGIFIKDSNSLAYYNMTSGSLIHLALKERGGRKK